jgi:uncharacterized protein (TIGR00251 family)
MLPGLIDFKLTSDGLKLKIKVAPKSSTNRIGKIELNGTMKIYVTAPAEDNKANNAVIDLLAKSLKIAKSDITIISGHKTPLKTLLIKGESTQLATKLSCIIS